MGRRKIKMEKITDNNLKQVTFSKRRDGIFNKANELATLFLAQVAVIVFSPGGQPHSFGFPSVNSVLQRYMEGGRPLRSPIVANDQAYGGEHGNPSEASASAFASAVSSKRERIERLTQQLNDLYVKLHAEKRRRRMLDEAIRANKMQKCEKPINELSLQELFVKKKQLEELQVMVKEQADMLEACEALLLLSKSAGK